MATRILRIKFEHCCGFANESKRQIDIQKYNNGDYYCLYSMMNTDGQKETTKKLLKARDVTLLFESLSTVQIQAFPNHQMGCDGGFTELEVGGYEGRSSFRWWSDPPESWKALDAITKQIISLCDIDNS